MKRSDVFQVQDPPPGGLTRLRARLDAAPVSPLRWLAPLAVALAAMVVALVLRPAPPVSLEASPATYAMGLSRGQGTVLESSLPLAALSAPGAAVEVYAVVGRAGP